MVGSVLITGSINEFSKNCFLSYRLSYHNNITAAKNSLSLKIVASNAVLNTVKFVDT